MNKGDNAWQMTAATMLGLQSIPRLVILYGSIVKKKWAINSAFMALYAFASVMVCWVGWDTSFGNSFLPSLGKIDDALDQHVLLEQAFTTYKFPYSTMMYFQFVFAAITLILIGAALLARMNFMAWMMFVPLWLTFSYTVNAFSIWCPNGWLSKMGLIYYSGRFFIRLSSGVAGFTSSFLVLGVVFVIGVNVLVTSLLCLLISLAVPLRMSKEELDGEGEQVHEEEEYVLYSLRNLCTTR